VTDPPAGAPVVPLALAPSPTAGAVNELVYLADNPAVDGPRL
jgi:hypothetical protein